jgi:hypothetical protein
VQTQNNYIDDNAQINQFRTHLEEGLEVDAVAKAQFCELVSLPTLGRTYQPVWRKIRLLREKHIF